MKKLFWVRVIFVLCVLPAYGQQRKSHAYERGKQHALAEKLRIGIVGGVIPVLELSYPNLSRLGLHGGVFFGVPITPP